MTTSLAAARRRGAAGRSASTRVDPVRLLSTIAAVLAGAGGVVHLAVVRHHVDEAAITVGFVLMGTGQLLVAFGVIATSSTRVRVAGVLLHVSIVTTWLLSRTVGLVIVPGAEDRSPFGLADAVANAFGVSVIVALVAAHLLATASGRQTASVRVAHSTTAAVVVAVLALTALAALAPHEHVGHDHPATSEPVPEGNIPFDDRGAQGHDHG